MPTIQDESGAPIQDESGAQIQDEAGIYTYGGTETPSGATSRKLEMNRTETGAF